MISSEYALEMGVKIRHKRHSLVADHFVQSYDDYYDDCDYRSIRNWKSYRKHQCKSF